QCSDPQLARAPDGTSATAARRTTMRQNMGCILREKRIRGAPKREAPSQWCLWRGLRVRRAGDDRRVRGFGWRVRRARIRSEERRVGKEGGGGGGRGVGRRRME